MKYSQLKAVLKAAGCYLVRQGGNHEIWHSPITDKDFALPRHGSHEVPTGTEKKIRKEAGI